MNLEKISDLIKTKRKEEGLTQEELACRLNVTEKAVSRWETGRGTPDISLLIPLSNEIGVSVSEILSGKEDKKSLEDIKNIIEYIDINKKSKNKISLIISTIIYVITLFLYLWYLKIEYDPNKGFVLFGEIICNTFFATCILCSNAILGKYYFDKNIQRENLKKVSYIIMLVLYSILILNLTIFARKNTWSGINLIPFTTIIRYISISFYYKNIRLFLYNVVTNIIMYIPLEYLILKIFNIKKTSSILCINLLITFIIELLQYVTGIGIFDIDDIILNVLGMMIIAFIMQKKNAN